MLTPSLLVTSKHVNSHPLTWLFLFSIHFFNPQWSHFFFSLIIQHTTLTLIRQFYYIRSFIRSKVSKRKNKHNWRRKFWKRLFVISRRYRFQFELAPQPYFSRQKQLSFSKRTVFTGPLISFFMWDVIYRHLPADINFEKLSSFHTNRIKKFRKYYKKFLKKKQLKLFNNLKQNKSSLLVLYNRALQQFYAIESMPKRKLIRQFNWCWKQPYFFLTHYSPTRRFYETSNFTIYAYFRIFRKLRKRAYFKSFRKRRYFRRGVRFRITKLKTLYRPVLLPTKQNKLYWIWWLTTQLPANPLHLNLNKQPLSLKFTNSLVKQPSQNRLTPNFLIFSKITKFRDTRKMSDYSLRSRTRTYQCLIQMYHQFASNLPICRRTYPLTVYIWGKYLPYYTNFYCYLNNRSLKILPRRVFRNILTSNIGLFYTRKTELTTKKHNFTSASPINMFYLVLSFYFLYCTYITINLFFQLRVLFSTFNKKHSINRFIIKRYTRALFSYFPLNQRRFFNQYDEVTFGQIISRKNLNLTPYQQTPCTPFSSYSIFWKKHNYLLTQQKLIFNSAKLNLRRVRFRPGYMTLWRTARTELKLYWNLAYKYQQRLTRFLIKFNKFLLTRLFIQWELQLINILIKSTFFPLQIYTNMFLQARWVYINGNPIVNPQYQLTLSDHIQLITSLRYYIVYRWLLTWTLKLKIRLRTRIKKHFSASTSDDKNKPSTFPSWLYRMRQITEDVRNFLEIDFFTLSIIIIYEPFLWMDLDIYHMYVLKISILNVYNWKYIV